jgi:glucose/arabinose dehydrogenase
MDNVLDLRRRKPRMTVARAVAAATATALSLVLAACGGPPNVRDTGPEPQLPDIRQHLVPTIKVARPTGWGDAVPTVPAGFRIVSFATDLRIPRQMLVLPNGDLLVAEERGGNAP